MNRALLGGNNVKTLNNNINNKESRKKRHTFRRTYKSGLTTGKIVDKSEDNNNQRTGESNTDRNMMESENIDISNNEYNLQNYGGNTENETDRHNSNKERKENRSTLLDTNISETHMLNVNVTELLIVPVMLDGRDVLAMIDSGATDSFISTTLSSDLGKIVDNSAIKMVVGYANKTTETLGSIRADLTLLGIKNSVMLQVINQENMKYQLILGIDYLKQNRITLDLGNNKIAMNLGVGSNISATVINNQIIDIEYQNIPIYASKNAKIPKCQNMRIPINFGDIPLFADENYYIEGKIKNNYLRMYEGIVSGKESEVIIENSNCKKVNKIKSGEIIGTISTLKTIEDEDSETSKWTMKEIKEQIKIKHDEISDHDRNKIYDMLMSVSEALSTGDADIGKADVQPHHIELTDYTPIWQKPRNFPDPVNNEIENQCQELLSNDIIEYSNSNYSSPVVPVRKSDGSLRLCIDYRKINSITKTEKFPMPNVANCIYQAHNIKFFTTLDLVRGYYQIPLDENSKQYTAFSTNKNHFQFNRLPFGLKNSGIAFQKTMQHILQPLSSNKVIIYIDDILIMSETIEEHLKLVQKVLNTLAKYYIKIKVKKCEFFKPSVTFLGHILSSEGISKCPEYTNKVANFPRPTNVTELRRFLGLINFQRKFIQNCSSIAKPLSKLTGLPKKTVIQWDDEMSKAFEMLKMEVTKEITLAYPNYDDKINKLELYVDASNVGAGACLTQKQNGQFKTIGYCSMTFSDTQKNYSTIERELAAIKWGCEIFRPFIFGIQFILFTDHKPLIYMNNMAPHNSRINRTIQELAEYDFEIKYHPGTLNVAADALSRLPVTENLSKPEEVKEDLPKELRVYKKVDGGGNSMFESILICLKDSEDENPNIPKDIDQMRQEVINELIKYPTKYKLVNNKYERNKLKTMLNNNQLPAENALLAASYLYNIEIRVYHNTKIPVVFLAKTNVKQTIHLQCISSIHYNPLYVRKEISSKIDERHINTIDVSNANTDTICLNYEIGSIDMNLGQLDKECDHQQNHLEIKVKFNQFELCAMLDTGAQVSVIDVTTWNKIKSDDDELELSSQKILVGMSGGSTEVVGVAKIKLEINNQNTDAFPFAIVQDSNLPCCLLLGLNYLKENKSIINFDKNYFQIRQELVELNLLMSTSSAVAHLGLISSGGESERNDPEVVKFNVTYENLKVMQKSNHAIKMLFNKVKLGVPTRTWKSKSLNQFKRHFDSLSIVNGLLVKIIDNIEVIVVSFPFLVEVIYKVHDEVAHVGRHKLLDTMKYQFWHPGMDNIAREICASCHYCQLNKTNAQHINPPVSKIDTKYPFQLMSIDLVQFPKSKHGHNVALVAVDHYSKWMTAVPLKNKSALAVSQALKCQIIPNCIKTPDNILSDNGLEFRGQETERVLQEFNINHIYSSPHHPASNGAVERVNRTLKDLIKASITDHRDWDIVLPKVIVIYNNTFHTQINSSPTKLILSQTHKVNDNIKLEHSTTDNWREGHPNFAPFTINQKVIKQIINTDHKVSNKFKPRFEGPFKVTKIQSNGVTYEIVSETNLEKIIKVHHKHLRPYVQLSDKLKKFIANEAVPIQNHVQSESFKQKDKIEASNNFRINKRYFYPHDSESDSSLLNESNKFINNSDISSSHSLTNNSTKSHTKSTSNGHSNIDNEYVAHINSSEDGELNSDGNLNIVSRKNKSKSLFHSYTCSFSGFSDANNLSKFACSEVVNYGDNINSTSNNLNFKQYLAENPTEAFSILEQTLIVHHEIVDNASMLLEEFESSLENINKGVNLDFGRHDVENFGLDDNVNNDIQNKINDHTTEKEDGTDFLGFREDNNIKRVSLLKQMLNLCKQGRINIEEGRSRSRNLSRQLWEWRESKNDTSCTSKGSKTNQSIVSEMTDYLMDLPTSTPIRRLRTQGKVEIRQNILQLPTELKKK